LELGATTLLTSALPANTKLWALIKKMINDKKRCIFIGISIQDKSKWSRSLKKAKGTFDCFIRALVKIFEKWMP